MVGMCGEAASDPLMIPLLLAFGLNEFSMSASAILKARKYITGYSVEELKAVAEQGDGLCDGSRDTAVHEEFCGRPINRDCALFSGVV